MQNQPTPPRRHKPYYRRFLATRARIGRQWSAAEFFWLRANLFG